MARLRAAWDRRASRRIGSTSKVVAVTLVVLVCHVGLRGGLPKPWGARQTAPSWPPVFSTCGGVVRPNETIVVMSDNRPPERFHEYWTLAAILNSEYAKALGYAFAYYRQVGLAEFGGGVGRRRTRTPAAWAATLTDGLNSPSKVRPTCALVDERLDGGGVARGAPWCKLAAVADALAAGYCRVVFVDSDAYFKAEAPVSVDALIRRYGRSDGLAAPFEASPWFASKGQGRNRVIQRRFNVGALDALGPEKGSIIRERPER